MGIQKQDLRIGNYVNVPRKEQSPFRVDYFDNVKVYQDNGTYECTPIGEIPMHPLTWDLADIEGIPLTPEILEKCGFELYDKDFGTMLQHKHLKCRYITEEINGNKISIPFLRFDSTGRPPFTKTDVYYLHQLQNLYFAISGQELEVNL